MSMYYLAGMIFFVIAFLLCVIGPVVYIIPGKREMKAGNRLKGISLQRKGHITDLLGFFCLLPASILLALSPSCWPVSLSLTMVALAVVFALYEWQELLNLKKMKAELRMDKLSACLDEDPWVDCSFPESSHDCLRKLRKHRESKQNRKTDSCQ